MKTILKNIKSGLIMAISGALVATTLFGGGLVLYTSIETNSYASSSTIDEIANYLNCDTSYIKQVDGGYARMQHNNDNPIYVYIEDEFTEEEKLVVYKSLDKVFGIISKINPRYRYQIVDKQEYDKRTNETRIRYVIKHDGYLLEDSLGEISSEHNLINKLTNKKLMNDYVISINRQAIAKAENPNELEYTLDHELGHAFSLADVYQIENGKAYYSKMQENTYMNNAVINKIAMFTPNDIKCWISVYAGSLQRAKELDEFLNEYTKNYYNEYTKKCIDKAVKLNDIYEEDFKFLSELTVVDENKSYGYVYEIEIKDNNYTFSILDKDTKALLDVSTGFVYSINGVKVLQGVNLKKGLRPNCKQEVIIDGVIKDIIIGDFSGGYKNKTTCFYDLQNNWKVFGDTYEIEKNMEQ